MYKRQIYAYEKATPDSAYSALSLSVSGDALNWAPREAQVRKFPSSEDNYDYLVPVQYRLQLDKGNRYVRLDFGGVADIVRVELDYR